MRWLFVLSLLVWGCMSQNKQDTSTQATSRPLQADGKPDLRDFVGKDALVDMSQLRFTSAEEQRRFVAARNCFAARGAAWEHFPLRKMGNFVQENWCRGEGAMRGCAGGGFTEMAGVDWAEIGTLHYPQSWPEVFGLQISGGSNLLKGEKGWNVSFSVNSNGKTILGDGAHIDFRRNSDYVHVGSGYEWRIEQERFAKSAEEDPWSLFERLRGSSDALRDEGVKQWRALEGEVIAALENDKVMKCVYGPYEGNGIPPACIRRVPLDLAQKTEELNKIRTSVGRIVELLEQEHVAMHAALLKLAPRECF